MNAAELNRWRARLADLLVARAYLRSSAVAFEVAVWAESRGFDLVAGGHLQIALDREAFAARLFTPSPS